MTVVVVFCQWESVTHESYLIVCLGLPTTATYALTRPLPRPTDNTAPGFFSHPLEIQKHIFQ